MFNSREKIEAALIRTGRKLALMGAGEYALLIGGGSALNLTGLIARPTRDVDVIACVEPDLKIQTAQHLTGSGIDLPDEVAQSAAEVSMELNLPEDWLNGSAAEVQRMGLPDGVLKRAERREFGPCLTVFLLARQDQVAFKLYAALDRQKGQRHLADLESIRPTRREMEWAVGWLLDRKTSAAFRAAIRDIVSGLGFQTLKAFDRSSRGRRKGSSAQ